MAVRLIDSFTLWRRTVFAIMVYVSYKMKTMEWWAHTTYGKWSVFLNIFFVSAISISIILVKVIKILNFNDHWWDVTVAIAFPASIIAFISGLFAVKKYGERSILVNLSILVSFCTILFILLHSLFIND